MRRIVPAVRGALVLLLTLAVGVLAMVVPEAPPAQAAAGDPVSYAYDDAGRLVGATDPAGDTAKYSYDPAGNLTSIDREPSSQVAILAFSPGRGPAGTTVTISGTGFATTAGGNTVKFNGTAATVTSATATRLVATVPAGAATGPISVTAPGGSATSSDPFTVAASKAPTITGFSPATGVPGTAVTITGTNFDTTELLNNVVAFNRARARVTAATSTSLTAEVPGAAGSGPISVRTPDGVGRSSEDFIIPPAPSTPADVEVSGRLTIGTAKTFAITTAGKVALQLFDGSEGQRVSVLISNATCCGSFGTLALLKPDGSTLSSNGSLNTATFLDQVALPVDGTYTVLVDPDGTKTGSFTLTVFTMTDVTGTVAANGQPTTLSLSTPGQNARYSLAGTAGQRISVQITNATCCTSVNSGPLAVLKPDGSTLASDSLTSPNAFLDAVTLPVDGTYTILLDPWSYKTGSFTVMVHSVTDVTGTVAANGSSTALSLSTPGQNGRYSLVGSAGQRVSVQVTNATCCGYPNPGTLAVLKPDGSTLTSDGLTSPNAFLDAVTLPVDGTYTVLLDPFDSKTGSFTLAVHSVTDVTGTIAANGQPTTLSLSTPGQNARYSLAGTQGQRISVQITNGTCCGYPNPGTLAVLKPDGSTLTSDALTAPNAFLDQMALPVDGSYTVLLDPFSSKTGNFTLQVHSVTDVTGTIAADGSSTALSLTAPGQNARYSLAGTAGQRISVQITNATCCGGSGTGPLAVLKPDGSTLASSNLTSPNAFLDAVALPVDGTYTVLLDPSGTKTGSFTLRVYSVTDVTGTVAADGSSTTFSLSTPGQSARYGLAGTAGQRVSVLISNATCCANNGTLAILKPDGSTLSSNTNLNTTTFLDAVTLPVDGTYTVLVNPDTTLTGSFTLRVYSVTDVTGTVAADGSSTSFSLTTPGQNARYSFTGTANQQVNLSLISSTIGGSNSCSSSNGTLAILKPDGSTLGSTSMCKPTTNLATQTLPADGTYTALVNPASTNTGSASVRLSTVTTLAAASGATATREPSAVPTTTTRPQAASAEKASANRQSTGGQAGDTQPAASSPSTDSATSKPAPAETGSPEEQWAPDARQLDGDPWLTRRPAGVWERLAPLSGPAGVTAVAGQTLTLDGQPLAGVTLRLEDKKTTSDKTGRFLLTEVPAGHHVLVVDGRSASSPGRAFGDFEIGVELAEGKTTALPATVWMPRLDTANTQQLTIPTTREVVLTTPKVPGLEVRIPAGSTIRDGDGKVVRELGITALPVDRPPFPLPAEAPFSMYFTVQPGGAYLFPEGAQIIYPNHTGEAPGTRVNFWSYDPKGKGWHTYGKGTVTTDGKQIMPDPEARVYAFTGGSYNVSGWIPAAIGAIKDAFAAFSGDPVDLGTGLFIDSRTDLYLPDTMPISITRSYRQSDSRARFFGVGANFDYASFLYFYSGANEVDLVLADSSRIHFVRVEGSGHGGAFEAQSTPTAFYKSRLAWNGWGWNLTLRNGTVYVFGQLAGLQSITDRNGNRITLTHANGASGNLTQITSPNGKWIKLAYDTSNRVTRAEDIIGRVVTYDYDASGRLIKVTGPGTNLTKYTYNASHQLTTITDARDIVYLTNEYDTNGRVRKQTLADQSTFQFAYTTDGNGKVTETQVTDPRGHVRKVTFDSGGFMASDTAAFGTPQAQTTTLERQAGTNLVTALTDQLGRRTAFGYDANGDVTSVTHLAGTAGAQTVSSVHGGPFGQVSEVTDPLNHKTTFSYDAKGNLTKVKDALDRETSFTYNRAGLPTSAKNGLGHTTRFTYELGDLAAVEDPLGRTTSQTFDAAGRVSGVTDPSGASSRIAYDALNQATSVTDPLGNSTSFSYDANGNLLTIKDPRNKVTTYTYNQMDQVKTLKDPLGKTQSYDYDANGNLATVTSRRGKVTSYSYDPLDRPTQVRYGVSGGSAETTVDYSWDAGNRLREIDDSAGGTITYTPDNLDRLTTETSPQGSISYGYDTADRLTSMTVAGQPQVTYGYNNADQPTTISQGSQSISVGYDSVGRPTTLNLPGGVSETYGLDDAAQLTAITYKQGTTTLGDLTYGYDQAARRSTVGGSFARVAIPDPFSSASYNDNNQLTSRAGVTYSYDDDGNLTSDGTTSYDWNARGQLTGLSRTGLSASFAYDAAGRRKSKTINGAATGYLHDGANSTQELSGTTPTANLLTGGVDQTFTRTDGTGQRTFLTDALGSTIALTDPSGAVKTSYTYEPFGKTTTTGESNANPQRYTGREDDGTGLYYYRARYYHPGLQRFISEDPAGFAAGDTNLYAYVGNNPTNLTDPSGENPAAGGGLVSTCLVNAAISGGYDFLAQRLSGRKVNWAQVGVWAGVGCVAGAGLRAVLGAGQAGGVALRTEEAFDFLAWVRRADRIPSIAEEGGQGYTRALLEVNGDTFLGRNHATGFPRPPGVAFQTMRHAEGDVFGQAAQFGSRGGHANLYIDQKIPCTWCSNSLEGLARSLDLDSMLVYTTEGLYGFYIKGEGFVRTWFHPW